MKSIIFKLMQFLLVSLLLAYTAPAQAEEHIIDKGYWASQPVSPMEMNLRVESAAAEYEEYAPVPRVALYDIAYPKDIEEFSATDGNGLLLVVVVVQDDRETPPKRVYLRAQGKDVPLTLISSVSSKQGGDTKVTKVFGRSRWEGLYYFPVYLRQEAETLMLDFAINRQGFILGDFTDSSAEELKYLPSTKPNGIGASITKLIAFIDREYPGFIGR